MTLQDKYNAWVESAGVAECRRMDGVMMIRASDTVVPDAEWASPKYNQREVDGVTWLNHDQVLFFYVGEIARLMAVGDEEMRKVVQRALLAAKNGHNKVVGE